MSLVFPNIPGRATIIPHNSKVGNIPLTIELKGSGSPTSVDWDGPVTMKAIVTSLSIRFRGQQQFLHTLRDFIYVYSFGEGMGEARMSGLAFADTCERPPPPPPPHPGPQGPQSGPQGPQGPQGGGGSTPGGFAPGAFMTTPSQQAAASASALSVSPPGGGGPGGGVTSPTGPENVIRFYDSNRLSFTGQPCKFMIGVGGVSYYAYLISMTLTLRVREMLNLSDFTLSFMIPPNSTSTSSILPATGGPGSPGSPPFPGGPTPTLPA